MGSTHALRPYRDADAPACAGVFDRAWHAGHPYAPRVIDEAVFLRETAGRRLIVAACGADRVLGFAGVHVPGAFVHHLYVDPPRAGGGIGRDLLAAALQLAGGRASLKCRLRNERALRFYEREGWTRGETGFEGGEPWIRLLSPGPRPLPSLHSGPFAPI
ncbi:GNAT family N-acetyltransferase [Salinarimonas soli]|uniref:GNAT family N-acetyltransferase n=1 Tax=Salinarimonas soli TaxID=1638099 RepID=A0A5B2VC72_9HYPH|nr:GNAT family N-acetyltransferase [Salinarimonas soli]KAA2236721.1 GNAT family N-acetyltransferase [Salinarimonas soli]